MKGVHVILYISYDGLCEPLGQSQVYQYIMKLAQNHGYKYHLITFEKSHDLANQLEINKLKNELKASNVHWHIFKYHKSPTALATSYDILMGTLLSLYLCLTQKIDVIHTRSYVPSVIALIIKKLLKVPFIFDMRGFWADEKIDAGSWRRDSPLYKITKLFERQFLLNAAKVVSLTQAAVDVMKRYDYLQNVAPDFFQVIPTCVNLELFTPAKNANSTLNKKEFTVGYVGGTRLWYMFDPVLLFFKEIKKKIPEAKLLIINRGEHELIKNDLEKYEISESDYTLKSINHKDVAAEMQKMSLTLFFIRPTFSKIASAPTKLGEFLACGVPCVTNPGVGDIEKIITTNNVGILTSDFNAESISVVTTRILDQLLDPILNKELRARCVQAANKNFSLVKAVDSYARMYSFFVKKI